MNNMEEIVKFTENHQKQEVTVVEPTGEMSEKLFKYLHKSDVRIISVVVETLK
jgi:transposase